jgi:hypothetical protein
MGAADITPAAAYGAVTGKPHSVSLRSASLRLGWLVHRAEKYHSRGVHASELRPVDRPLYRRLRDASTVIKRFGVSEAALAAHQQTASNFATWRKAQSGTTGGPDGTRKHLSRMACLTLTAATTGPELCLTAPELVKRTCRLDPTLRRLTERKVVTLVLDPATWSRFRVVVTQPRLGGLTRYERALRREIIKRYGRTKAAWPKLDWKLRQSPHLPLNPLRAGAEIQPNGDTSGWPHTSDRTSAGLASSMEPQDGSYAVERSDSPAFAEGSTSGGLETLLTASIRTSRAGEGRSG